MRVTFHEMFTGSFKSNYLIMNFLMPLSEENATNCALLAQVLKRGCEKYGEMHQIACRLEELYGASIAMSSDKIGENISFTLLASYLDDRFALEGEKIAEMTIDVLSNILLRPFTEGESFRASYFTQEQQNLADVIRSQINDKRLYAMLRCREISFAGRPYRFTSDGTLSCLKEITAASLYSFYKKMLANAKVLVTYTGRETDVQGTIRTCFPILFEGEANALAATKYDAVTAPKNEEEALDIVQGKLCLGFRFSNPPEYYAARLFNVIYGGSPVSKLFMNVREKLSLCYYCSSEIDPFVGALFVSSGIESGNFATAKDEIIKQLDDVKNGVITEEEFTNAKLYLLDYVKGLKDAPGPLMADATRQYLLNIDDGIDEQIQKIKALTVGDVTRAAGLLQLDTVYFLHEKEFKA